MRNWVKCCLVISSLWFRSEENWDEQTEVEQGSCLQGHLHQPSLEETALSKQPSYLDRTPTLLSPHCAFLPSTQSSCGFSHSPSQPNCLEWDERGSGRCREGQTLPPICSEGAVTKSVFSHAPCESHQAEAPPRGSNHSILRGLAPWIFYISSWTLT